MSEPDESLPGDDEFSLRRLADAAAGSAVGAIPGPGPRSRGPGVQGPRVQGHGPAASPVQAGGGSDDGIRMVPRDDELFRERFDVRQYWDVVWRHRGVVLLTVVAVFAFSAYFTWRQPDQYSATATLMKEEQGRMVPGYGYLYRPQRLEGVAKLATLAPEVAEMAVAEFKGAWDMALSEETERAAQRDREYRPDPAAAAQAERILAGAPSAAAALRGAVDVSADKDGQYIYMQASGQYALLVAAYANAMAEGFRKWNRDQMQKTRDEEAAFIDGQIQSKQRDLQRKEQEILQERRRLLTEVGGEVKEVISTEADLQLNLLMSQEGRLAELEIEKEASDISLASLQERIAAEADQVVMEESVTNPWQVQLVKLYMEREDNLTRFTEQHPTVQAVDKQIDRMETLVQESQESRAGVQVRGANPVKSEMRKMLASEMVRNASLAAQLQALGVQVAQKNTELLSLPEITLPLERLKSEKSVLEKVILTLNERLENAKTVKDYEIEDMRVVGPARVPGAPYAPDRVRNVGFAVFIGLLLGIGLAFVLAYLDNTIKSPSDITREFDLTPLGIVPLWKRREDLFIQPDEPLSGISEVYGVLRNNIRHASVHRPERCLLIASALQGEGKSTTATNLALSYAMEGNRTLLIDTDFRRIKQHEITEVVPLERAMTVGLTDYLQDYVKLSDIFYRTSLDRLMFIPAGRRVSNPARLLRSQRMSHLLESVRDRLDVVIVDAPAVLPVVDTTLISNLVSGVLLVVGCEEAPIPAVRQAVDRLRHVNSPLIGAMLNKVQDIPREHFYFYAYYSGGYHSGEER